MRVGDVLAVAKFLTVMLIIPFLWLFGMFLVASSFGGEVGKIVFASSAFVLLALQLWLGRRFHIT